ncbi:uncharacterized protein BJ212DRAFT_386931 [Suillus subaureus]|uniref:Uncharacterized protein n=1 Tax=Suillus subaureus TaxID=48587 RepID=A0A9P7E8L6_9AGAM|nr:uncharacterized protein BJ212DRAFT_386931 [Suillus subaureus]KAG1813987.1 hypothetical protein BJ212DRAFT_386931 [Suillus subaureus]
MFLKASKHAFPVARCQLCLLHQPVLSKLALIPPSIGSIDTSLFGDFLRTTINSTKNWCFSCNQTVLHGCCL